MKKKISSKVNISQAEFIKLFKSMTQVALAERLGVSQPAIVYHAKRFGLSKSREKRLHFK